MSRVVKQTGGRKAKQSQASNLNAAAIIKKVKGSSKPGYFKIARKDGKLGIGSTPLKTGNSITRTLSSVKPERHSIVYIGGDEDTNAPIGGIYNVAGFLADIAAAIGSNPTTVAKFVTRQHPAGTYWSASNPDLDRVGRLPEEDKSEGRPPVEFKGPVEQNRLELAADIQNLARNVKFIEIAEYSEIKGWSNSAIATRSAADIEGEAPKPVANKGAAKPTKKRARKAAKGSDSVKIEDNVMDYDDEDEPAGEDSSSDNSENVPAGEDESSSDNEVVEEQPKKERVATPKGDKGGRVTTPKGKGGRVLSGKRRNLGGFSAGNADA
uniref:Uncharacterized protein n=1 Tax=viral metagenome TaxID=1070528 RepID=A0A6C0JSR8_9ZZZZ